MSAKRQLQIRRVVMSLIIGMCAGFAILHPISMLIGAGGSGIHVSPEEFFRLWSSRPHRAMSLYFTALGGAVGILQGVLMSRLVERNRRVIALEGLLPICANCKRIRETNERGEEKWMNLEQFISGKTAAEFTHSICPDCTRILYPEFVEGRKTSE